MALTSLRLRRTLTGGLSTLRRSLSSTPALSFPNSSSSSSSSSPLLRPHGHGPTSAQSPASPPSQSSSPWTFHLLQSRTYRTYGNNNEKDEIGPDTILFEGCDYNHWLIVMDFPRENKPPPEEMVRTYEETAARGLNISVEEAKQKIYACSTTTYTGFQVLMSEQESQKFEGLPGVIFVLPDSYIDPQNKEYGGDKYINGTIIPRPPPVQYGRQGGRYNDRNRNPDRQRYDRPPIAQQGPMQGNTGPSPNYQQRQGENRGPIPVSTPGGRDAYQPGRDSMPPYQGNYNQGEQRTYYPQEQRNFPQGNQRNYAPPGPGETRGDNRNYGPPHTETHGQGLGGFQGQGAAGGYGQGPSSGGYGQGPSTGGYGQGPSAGGYGQGPSTGGYGQGPSSGAYGQGQSSGNGQGYPGHGGDQRFSQGEQWNVQGEQRNYGPSGQTGSDQGRY